jgi:hypothetical protein
MEKIIAYLDDANAQQQLAPEDGHSPAGTRGSATHWVLAACARA